ADDGLRDAPAAIFVVVHSVAVDADLLRKLALIETEGAAQVAEFGGVKSGCAHGYGGSSWPRAYRVLTMASILSLHLTASIISSATPGTHVPGGSKYSSNPSQEVNSGTPRHHCLGG